ncbi:MAG: Ni/Fe hydrogenase subunit alpha [Candidatus Asgardarchaeia archaeon]
MVVKTKSDDNIVIISPVTRLEGEAKISIILDENGNAKDAYFQVVELRGFEKFCEGRPVEEMPRIVPRICGVCPWAHHLASAKATDVIFGAELPKTAKMLRELGACAHILHSHLVHFYALAAPDLLLNPDYDPSLRNIFGLLKEYPEIARSALRHRGYAKRMQQIIGGKSTHPIAAIPGGMSKGLTPEERDEIKKMAKSCVDFLIKSFEIFEDQVKKRKDLRELIEGDTYNIKTYYMGTVDKNGYLNFYDGTIRVVNQGGKEVVSFKPENYLDHVGETVLEWSYLKVAYLKDVGWNGLSLENGSGIYRVNSLARLNAVNGVPTEHAKEAYERMYEMLGGKPAHNGIAFNWARIVEMIYASERILELIEDDDIIGKDFRITLEGVKSNVGVGSVEAPRGTLFHHYEVDDNGLITRVNLVIPTTQNNAAICLSVKKAAKQLIKNGKISEGLLNRIEMAFRAYDPCLACATHAMIGAMPMTVEIYDSEGNLVERLKR